MEWAVYFGKYKLYNKMSLTKVFYSLFSISYPTRCFCVSTHFHGNVIICFNGNQVFFFADFDSFFSSNDLIFVYYALITKF
jgi:hypothetical protein